MAFFFHVKVSWPDVSLLLGSSSKAMTFFCHSSFEVCNNHQCMQTNRVQVFICTASQSFCIAFFLTTLFPGQYWEFECDWNAWSCSVKISVCGKSHCHGIVILISEIYMLCGATMVSNYVFTIFIIMTCVSAQVILILYSVLLYIAAVYCQHCNSKLITTIYSMVIVCMYCTVYMCT